MIIAGSRWNCTLYLRKPLPTPFPRRSHNMPALVCPCQHSIIPLKHLQLHSEKSTSVDPSALSSSLKILLCFTVFLPAFHSGIHHTAEPARLAEEVESLGFQSVGQGRHGRWVLLSVRSSSLWRCQGRRGGTSWASREVYRWEGRRGDRVDSEFSGSDLVFDFWLIKDWKFSGRRRIIYVNSPTFPTSERELHDALPLRSGRC